MAGEVHHGSCLCGAVSFTISAPLGPVCGCHCTMCRRHTGHFLASISVSNDDIAIEGEDAVGWYGSSDEARRGFCRTCGSTLFWQRIGSGRIAVAAGSLDLPTGVSWEGHIFVADKGDYYEIEPGSPQYPAHD